MGRLKEPPLFIFQLKLQPRRIVREKKLFTVTDLGPGDGGKGGIVHGISCFKKAHTILKVGGAQGCHGVRTSRGQRFNFSQFGCGTFEGARTHITPLLVMEPIGLLDEANRLAYGSKVSGAHEMITIDENTLCATLYHAITSKLKELARKERQKGTIGMGIGEAKLDSELYPELAIYAKDLGRPDLRDRLNAVREHKLRELASAIDDPSYFWPADRDLAEENIKLLRSTEFLDWMVGRIVASHRRFKFVDGEYLSKEILSKDGVIVVESSHGVLTDRYYGFHPYVSRLRTLPHRTLDMLESHG